MPGHYCQNGPFQCPSGSSCGNDYTVTTEACTVETEGYCLVLVPTSFCCGKYHIPLPEDPCAFTEMKDPHVRSRLLALAEDNDILVPTRGGAYVPARIAFRENKGNVNGGL